MSKEATKEAIRILVIDDDPVQLSMVERALPSEWFDVRCVEHLHELPHSGREHRPQVVLLDVNLPDSPPDRTIALVREAAPGARIVLYSAWEESKLRALCKQLGADAYISKSESVIGIGRKLRELQGSTYGAKE